ncbi:hypothetical protein LAJ19_21345 (plasmid) [Deinococcus taeanensis]|uniref:hypothetical protein n=1 Tax=Deinococcus taeanensis TaxID=2737050 RepID=UPI001CDBEC3C|nr:hypothetical protein [Deinococcus taeanensis]UBV45533.1 hypothetical protein LAJ19_21345 [Deinococcus taeanensis]
MRRADEINIVVHDPEDITAGLDAGRDRRSNATVWLHPEWSKARDRDSGVLNAITHAVKTDPHLRAGYKMHKLYRADDLDARSDKRLVPLGGNPALGY